jgi:hypothetical protein
MTFGKGRFVAQTILFLSLLAGTSCSDSGSGGPATLKALLADSHIVAGTSTTVSCFQVRGSSDNLVSNVTVKAYPAEGIEIHGNLVTTKSSGTFDISCIYNDGTPSIPVPATLNVLAGAIVSTDLTFQPEVVPAGQYAEAKCQARDAFGNVIATDSAQFAIVGIQESLHVEGLYVHGTIAGSYNLSCDLITHASEERVLGKLTVVPGAAKELKLSTEPVSIVFGTDETALLKFNAMDAYGNEIASPDIAPLSITPDNKGILVKNGFTLDFQMEGVYIVNAHITGNPEVNGSVQIIVDEDGPSLVVESPEQAIRVDGDNQLIVSGTVQDSLALITEFKVNDTSITPAEDGSFETVITLEPGINAINIEAINAHGLRSRETRWVTFAENYIPLTKGVFDVDTIESGTRVHIGPAGIDDGDHSPEAPNDLATILETSLTNLSLEDTMGGLSYELFSTGSESSFGITYSLTLQSVTNSAPTLSLQPAEGYLVLTLNYENVEMEGLLDGSCLIGGFLDICPDAGFATINVDQATLTAWVVPTVNPETQMIGFDVIMADTDLGTLDIEWTGDLQAQLEDIEPLLNGEFGILFEAFLNTQVLDKMPQALEEVLNGWNIDHNFQIPGLLSVKNMDINLSGLLANITVTHEGMTLHLDTQVRDGSHQFSDHVGSIGTLGCDGADVDSDAALMFGVADPVINRFLHLLWVGGLLNMDAQIPYSAHAAGYCGFGPLSSVLGADPGSARVNVQPLLPPVANGCAKGELAPEYRIQLGAFSVSYSYRKAGQERTIDFLLGMDAPITPSNSDALALSLDSPHSVLVDVVSSTGLSRTEQLSIIEKLEGQGASNLVQGLNGCLGNVLAFAPVLDAAKMVPQNEEMVLQPEFENFKHGQGALWFQGNLK